MIWEIDNYLQIIERCEAVQLAIRQSDDATASHAYAELNHFIGNRTIERESLAIRVGEVRKAIIPVNERFEQSQREREAQERTARRQARAKRRQLQTQEVRTTDRQSNTGYKGFTESELKIIYEDLRSKGYSSEDAILTTKAMLDYPDTRAAVRQKLDGN